MVTVPVVLQDLPVATHLYIVDIVKKNPRPVDLTISRFEVQYNVVQIYKNSCYPIIFGGHYLY